MKQLAGSTSIPAPVGGLNDRDSIADMPKTDAVVLNNWWPYPSYLEIRKGYFAHSTGFTNTVETLFEYLPTSGDGELFAIAGGDIYDCTANGVIGAPVLSGLLNSRWQHQNITTPGGSFVYLVNGQDSPLLYDGATWTSITGVSTPAITGVTTSELVNVTLFKNRLFFTRTNSLSIYYLPVNSVGGALGELPLGSVFRNGGYVMACYPWTIDAGNGADDHFVIITSTGEVAVYRGTDPSSSSAWSLVGVFQLGVPLGRRCGVKLGGDLAVNTMEGVFPLGKALLSASVDRRVALTDKIQNSTSQAASLYSDNDGWELCLFPDANMLILNVPQGSGYNYQYAQNTITGAWAKFTGWDAHCWLNASTGLYFGSGAGVNKAWTNNLDDTTVIEADILPAFSYFGSKAQNKYFTLVKPYLMSTGYPSALYGLNIDFQPNAVTGVLSYTAPSGMVWGDMGWGSMVWGGALVNITNWQTVGAVANSAAMRLVVQNNGSQVRLTNIDYVYQKGGIL